MPPLAWKADWLFTQPGKIYSYSNPGFWLAGFLAETIDHKPYADVMQERVFGPLGMVNSTLRPTMAMTRTISQGHDVAEKKLKVLGVGGTTPVPQLPGSPTVSDSGVPGYTAGTWFGLATTAGTPRDVVMKINTEVQKILSNPAFQQRFMAPQMFEPMASAPEPFAEYIKSETQSWAKVLREQGLKLE